MDRLKPALSLLIPAVLPLLVIALVFPLAVYAPNVDEFRSGSVLAISAVWVFLLGAAIIFPLVLLTRGQAQERVSKGLFFLGVFLLVSDIVAPVRVGQLFEGNELAAIPEPFTATIYEIVLAVALIAAAVLVKWRDGARKMAGAFVVLVLVGQAVTLGGIVFKQEAAKVEAKKAEEQKAADAVPVDAGTKGNIYHVMFDSYGPGFEDHAKEMNMSANFDGFTLFKDAITNADYTGVSFPSFMTGTLFIDDADPMNVWQRKWRTGYGLFGDLAAAGYKITQYQGQWLYEGEATTIEPGDLWQNKEETYQFWDIVLLRVVPNAMQQELFVGGRGLVSREAEKMAGLMHGRGAYSRILSQGLGYFKKDADKSFALTYGNYRYGIDAVELMRRMTADEASRPAKGQYVFVHILLPHGPFNIDRDLNVRGVKTNPHEQSLASVHLMNNFITELKRLGRYKDATIVFHGDHGSSKEIDEPLERGFKKDVHTLVLVKPAGASDTPLKVSNAEVQLLDIAPTVYAAAGVDPKRELRGSALFSKGFPANRSFEIFTYLQPFNDDTQELLHYTYSRSGGWKQHPNILPKLDEKLKQEDKGADAAD